MLEERGIKIVSPYEQSDWIVINTCGFIRDAKEESIDEILQALEKKENGEISHLAVTGCLPQRYHDELKQNFPNADIIWGVNDPVELADAISANEKKEYRGHIPFLLDHSYKRLVTTPLSTTFIKISEGCDMNCSFCSIPAIRGPYRSRDIHSILKEAEKYLDMGFQEINLISQNSTYFGKDKGKKSLLPALLKDLSELGFPWIRVLYLMPEEMDDRMIQGFSHPSVLPYFDLPFQHVAEPVLKKMNRGGNRKKNSSMIEKIRKTYPGAIIRSTFIVGFPGESESDFQELLSFSRDSRIERIGVFGYSPEEGTPAFDLEQTVADELIEERKQMLMDVSDQNLVDYNKSGTGTVQDFLPLGPWQSDTTIGRIPSQAPDVDGLTQLNRKFDESYTMKKIKITGFQNEMLTGEPE